MKNVIKCVKSINRLDVKLLTINNRLNSDFFDQSIIIFCLQKWLINI